MNYFVKMDFELPVFLVAPAAGYGQNHWACGKVSGKFQKTFTPNGCGLADEHLVTTCRLMHRKNAVVKLM